MVTAQDIIDLLPDEILVQLTDDMDSGSIKTEVIDKLISQGYDIVNALNEHLADALKDEAVRKYVLEQLYRNAGRFEEADRLHGDFSELIERNIAQSVTTRVASDSAERVFTDDELRKW